MDVCPKTQLHGDSWLVSARRSFQVSAPKFSVVGARKKYFLMNFRFRKVFAPLSAVREKSKGRGFVTNTCYGLNPRENVPLLEKQTQKLGSAAAFGGADQASSKEVVPLTVQFCSFILHDCFHPSLTHPSPLAFCALILSGVKINFCKSFPKFWLFWVSPLTVTSTPSCGEWRDRFIGTLIV